MNKDTKTFKRFKISLKQMDEDEEKGVIRAIASSNNIDRTDDIIPESTLMKAIENAKQEGLEKIPMKFMHKGDVIIGSFAVDEMRVNEGNLEVVGKINLETTMGSDAYALVKAGDLSALSVGIYILDAEYKDGIRIIKDMFIFEISVVDIPANADAQIQSVKNKYNDNNENNGENSIMKTFNLEEIEDLKSLKEIEAVLKEAGFSVKASKCLISNIKGTETVQKADTQREAFLQDLKNFTNSL